MTKYYSGNPQSCDRLQSQQPRGLRRAWCKQTESAPTRGSSVELVGGDGPRGGHRGRVGQADHRLAITQPVGAELILAERSDAEARSHSPQPDFRKREGARSTVEGRCRPGRLAYRLAPDIASGEGELASLTPLSGPARGGLVAPVGRGDASAARVARIE